MYKLVRILDLFNVIYGVNLELVNLSQCKRAYHFGKLNTCSIGCVEDLDVYFAALDARLETLSDRDVDIFFTLLDTNLKKNC